MSIDTEGQSPAERAKRYLAKAEQARQLMEGTLDEGMRASLKKLVDNWEYLAHQILGQKP